MMDDITARAGEWLAHASLRGRPVRCLSARELSIPPYWSGDGAVILQPVDILRTD